MDEETEPMLQWFAYMHLQPRQAEVAHAFNSMAHRIVREIPRSPERTVALRKLLESKDAAVRASL